MSEGLNKRCWTSSLFISMHRTPQPRSGWPSMYSGGFVVGKASLIDPEISPTSPVIFTGAIKKYEIWRHFQHHSTLSRPRLKMQHGIRTLNQNCNAAMIALCPRRPPWKPFGNCPTPKIVRQKRAKSSTTEPWIIRFRSNFAKSLNKITPEVL